jgi:hypothetical protein
MTAYRIMVAAQRTATTAPLGTRPFVRPSRCRKITPSLKGPSIFTELRGTNFKSWRSVCPSSTLAEVPVDAARRAPGLTLAVTGNFEMMNRLLDAIGVGPSPQMTAIGDQIGVPLPDRWRSPGQARRLDSTSLRSRWLRMYWLRALLCGT